MPRSAGDEPHDDDRSGSAGTRMGPAAPAPLFDSAALFGRQTEIGIAHAGEVYRLRITRQGKLVLNK